MSESAPNENPSSDPNVEHESQHGPSLFDSMRIFQAGKENVEFYRPGSHIANEMVNAGDVIVVEAQSDSGQEKGYMFTVNQAAWNNLGLSGASPSKALLGTVDGLFVPDEMKGKQVQLIGSGIDGSAVTAGMICRGREPYFGSLDGEFHMPAVSDCGILISDQKGGHTYFNHQEQESRPDVSQETKETDTRNREAVQGLFESLPIIQHCLTADEFLSGRVPKNKEFQYDDEDYAIKFNYRPENGAQLVILSKTKQKIVFCTYYSPDNEHLLQISEVDIRENPSLLSHIDDLDDLKTDTICRSGASYITYNTSPTLGLNEVTYQPSDMEAMHEIGISSHDLGLDTMDPRLQTSPPAIQLWEDRSVKLDFPSLMRKKVAENRELGNSIASKIGAAWNPGQHHVFQVGEKFITARTPQEILGSL